MRISDWVFPTAIGCVCGFLIIGGAIVPVKRKVIEEKVIVTKHVEAPTPAPPPEDDSCLKGKSGTLITLKSRVVGEPAENETLATFKLDGYGDLVVTCVFRTAFYEDVWKPGMYMQSDQGERLVGSQDNPK